MNEPPKSNQNRKAENLLLEMIKINSENPDMNPDSLGESALAMYVKRYLQGLSLETSLDHVLPARPNVYGLLRSTKPTKETLIFEMHMDTVPIDNCVKPCVKDGIIYGRGACDTKGSLAAILLALEQLVEMKDNLPINVFLMATVDEEYRYRGVLGAIDYLKKKSDLKAVGAVVGEPTQVKVITAHKACLRWKIRVHGKSGHSSDPNQGLNAIYIMAEIIHSLRTKWDIELKQRKHPLLGYGTYNIGIIQGGKQINIIPDYCEIQLERRLIPGENEEQVLNSCDAVIRDVQELYPDAKIERLEPYLRDYTLDTDKTEPIISNAIKAIHDVSGEDTSLNGVAYGTDASKLAQLGGIPSIVLGPGNIEYAHTEHEKISTEQVLLASEVYKNIILNWSKEYTAGNLNL